MMKRKAIRITILLISIALVLGCGVYFLVANWDNIIGDKIYDEIIDIAVIPPPEDPIEKEKEPEEEAPEPEPEEEPEPLPEEPEGPPLVDAFPEYRIDFDKLAEVNGDIFAWIWIPDSRINFPVLQGYDNYQYLYRAYNGDRNNYGSIFIDYRNTKELTDDNTLIYGHNMRNEAMFGTLSDYTDQEFAQTHTELYLYMEGRIYRYFVYSAYTANIDSWPFVISFDTASKGSHERFLQFTIDQSEVSIELENPLTAEDRVITLVTCLDYGPEEKRFVVHARLDVILDLETGLEWDKSTQRYTVIEKADV